MVKNDLLDFRLSTYLILQLVHELLIARHDVRPILDEAAQSPKSERGFAVLFYYVQMRIVRPATHLACLRDNCVYTL